MNELPLLKSNVPEFTVTELAGGIKRSLEDNFARVRVRGELGRVTRPASGHLYANLKDDGASIDAVCWKMTLPKLSIKPEEGLEVICTGRVSSYPASSKYQLIIDSMELAGEGALLKMLEERRKKLAAEGLFDAERKKPIPFLPEVIGVITSPTGAVIRDILHRLSDRFPRHVLIWPVPVQGDQAAAQVTAAIQGFDALDGAGLPRPDLIIVARGGGSLEDLMPFNDEAVVRAVAACRIPLISAVGHETDTTLIDYAADLRAPTPTGAAEMAVPRRADLLAQVLDDQKRLLNIMTRQLSESRHKLEARAAKISDPSRLLEKYMQSLDHAGDRMSRIFRQFLTEKRSRITESAARLRHPQDRIKDAGKHLQIWAERLSGFEKKLLNDHRRKLEQATRLLKTLSHESILQRGFVLVQDENGKLIADAGQTKAGQNVELMFRDNQKRGATIKD